MDNKHASHKSAAEAEGDVRVRADRVFRQSDKAFGLHDWASVVQSCRDCLSILPTHAGAIARLVEALLAQKSEVSAKRVLGDACSRGVNTLEIQLLQARVAAQMGDHSAAVDWSNKILRQEADCVPALHFLASSCDALNRQHDRLPVVQRLVLTFPRNAEYHRQLADCYHQLDRFHDEIASLTNAIDLESSCLGPKNVPCIHAMRLHRAQARLRTTESRVGRGREGRQLLWYAVHEMLDLNTVRRPDYEICLALARAYKRLEYPKKELAFAQQALHHAQLLGHRDRIDTCKRFIRNIKLQSPSRSKSKSRSRSDSRRSRSRSRSRSPKGHSRKSRSKTKSNSRSRSPKSNKHHSRSRSGQSRSKSKSRSRSRSPNEKERSGSPCATDPCSENPDVSPITHEEHLAAEARNRKSTTESRSTPVVSAKLVEYSRSRSRSTHPAPAPASAPAPAPAPATAVNDPKDVEAVDVGCGEPQGQWYDASVARVAELMIELFGTRCQMYANVIKMEEIDGKLLHTILFETPAANREAILSKSFDMGNLHQLKLLFHLKPRATKNPFPPLA